jgi:putative ABC transport system permease protein
MLADLVAAWRQLRRSPAHVVIVVISLGVGMAVSAAAFSVVNALAFEERPGIDTRSGLCNIRWNAGAGLLSEQDFEVIERELGTVFSAAAAEARRSVPVVLPSEPITAPASFVSPLYFEALGTQPAHGRLLTPYDAAPDAPAAALIGERFWRESFGASADILGRPITIGGHPFTIVGVTPAEFSGLIPRDVGQGEGAIPRVWLPLRHYAAAGGPLRSVPSLSVAGRLRAGVPVKRALAELAVVGSRLRTDPAKGRDGVSLWGYRAGIDWSDNPIEVAAVLGVFLFVPLAVLAIGCANVINLQMARATERSRELGVRLALGASRGRLARLLGLEVVFLAALAGFAGWRGAVVLLLVAAPYLQLPVTVDPEALTFVFCLAIGVIGVSGFAPAWLATRHAIAAGLKDTRDGGIQHKRLRAALVVLQVAVSLLFLFVSALGVRTLHSFVPSLPPGADKAAVARFDLAASHPGLRDSRPFLDGMLARLAGAPGITAAGFADFVRGERGVWYSGLADAGGVRRFATGGQVTPGWFDAFGARLIVGRGFDGSDVDRATAIVNEGMAAMLASGPGSMLGRTLRVSYSADGPQRSVEIVGVVADHLTLQSGRGAPAVYLPMPRVSPASILLVARASDLPAAAAAIKAALVAIDPDIPWVTLTTLEGASGDPLKGLRSGTWIGGGLGLCALVIAAIGLHAVLAYMIRRRTHEIGIRLAVGADRKAIVWLVLRQGLGLVLAGTLLGLAAAVPLGHMLRAGFVGLSPVDPVALLAPVPLLFLVGLLAAAVPALRAASVDPIVVLREP